MKSLIKYYILNEINNNIKSIYIIGNLKNVHKISEKIIYEVIEEMVESGEYKVID